MNHTQQQHQYTHIFMQVGMLYIMLHAFCDELDCSWREFWVPRLYLALGLALEPLSLSRRTLGLGPVTESLSRRILGLGPEPLSLSRRFLGLGPEPLSRSSRTLGFGPEPLSRSRRTLGLGPELPSRSRRTLGFGPGPPSLSRRTFGPGPEPELEPELLSLSLWNHNTFHLPRHSQTRLMLFEIGTLHTMAEDRTKFTFICPIMKMQWNTDYEVYHYANSSNIFPLHTVA